VLLASQAIVLVVLLIYGELRALEMMEREAQNPATINAALTQSLIREMAIVWLMGGLITAGAAVLFVVRLGSAIQEVRRSAVRFASGDLRHRIEPSGSAELRDLARSLNRMAGQLSGQFELLEEQQSEQDTILQSMQVGVIAVDESQLVLSINRVAQLMLGVHEGDPRGKKLAEITASGALLRFAADTLAEPTDSSREFELRTTGEPLFVRALAGRLRDRTGEPIGVVIILSDITRVRRLERLRSDFAANVSHELRTPITNIKGYVETLLEEGALEAPQAGQFLGIIARNAERLGDIIDDMLSLTSLERADTQERLVTQPTPIGTMLNAVRSHLEPEARARGSRMTVKVDRPLFVEVNARLAEQAVANLVSNAVKYCPPGSTVQVSAHEAKLDKGAPAVEIVVRDDGPGIAPEHMPRLFERFYRVDKARSRAQGGTGLGLAIVKHIAIVHGGSVTAESELGKGSTFRLRFPAADDPARQPKPGLPFSSRRGPSPFALSDPDAARPPTKRETSGLGDFPDDDDDDEADRPGSS
jgi:two-component system phosphate regulon sensor histidine kinase PhoR